MIKFQDAALKVRPKGEVRKVVPKKAVDLVTVDRAGLAALRKKRTAPPSTKVAAGGSGPPEKPPLSAAAAGRSPGPVSTWLVKGPTSLLGRAERERVKRGLRSRNDAIVAVLEEGLAK